MRVSPFPRLHLFVCANRRADTGLGPGCGDRGDRVYDALKEAVSARGDVRTVWITKTACLGICPQHGATVARYGVAVEGTVCTDVVPTDVPALLDPSGSRRAIPAEVAPAIFELLGSLEDLQRKKVLDLARRLSPGLTMEDVRNPHDFPELDDPDWHYADGVLTGITSVKTALAARIEDAKDLDGEEKASPEKRS